MSFSQQIIVENLKNLELMFFNFRRFIKAILFLLLTKSSRVFVIQILNFDLNNANQLAQLLFH